MTVHKTASSKDKRIRAQRSAIEKRKNQAKNHENSAESRFSPPQAEQNKRSEAKNSPFFAFYLFLTSIDQQKEPTRKNKLK